MSSQPPARRRNLALVTADIVAGIVFIVFGAFLALSIIVTATSFGAIHEACGAGPYEGVVCNGTVLNIAIFGMIAVAVIAFFLGLGFFVVAMLRKRYGFFWPLGAIVVTLVLYYLGTWIVGLTVAGLTLS